MNGRFAKSRMSLQGRCRPLVDTAKSTPLAQHTQSPIQARRRQQRRSPPMLWLFWPKIFQRSIRAVGIMKALIVAATLAAGCSLAYPQATLADQSMGAYRAQLEAQKQQIELQKEQLQLLKQQRELDLLRQQRELNSLRQQRELDLLRQQR
jgi:hypothetical protein